MQSFRRSLLVIAVVIALAHIVGIELWIVLSPNFSPSFEHGPPDLVVYHQAGIALAHRQPLYWLSAWPNVMAYYYSPPFALLHAWLLALPFRIVALLALLVQVCSYLLGWWLWYRLLLDLKQPLLARAIWLWFPISILYTQWLAHTFFLNTTGFLCLLVAVLVWAIVRERSGVAVLAALPIALLKPQWLFPLILLIAFQRWRLLAHILIGLTVSYVLIAVGYCAIVGWQYGTASFRDYALFLVSIDANFPWSASTMFTDQNHSMQRILREIGLTGLIGSYRLFFLFTITAIIGVMWKKRVTIAQAPQIAVLLVWLAYLAMTAQISQLWGLDAGMFAFVAIWSLSGPVMRKLLLAFLVYACWEAIAAVELLVGGSGLWFVQHVPITLFALLLLYAAGLLAFTKSVLSTKKEA